MSLNGFIPTIWSNKLLVQLEKAHKYGQSGVVNRDYEGEIRQAGDTVKINAVGPINLFDYNKNQDMTPPQELTEAQSVLEITQQKAFSFQVDDIDKAQGRPDVVSQAMQNASYAIRNEVDRFIAARMVEGASTSNTIGSTGTPKTISTATDAYDLLVDAKVKLDENNIPEEGRWIIVPPFFEGALLKDDRFVKAPNANGANALLNGQQRYAAGFSIMISNNVPHKADESYYRFFAGTSMAFSFAEQIVSIEAFRMEKRFADAVKGLHVYGGKVIRPEALVQLIVDRP